ncbi:SDR family NAD(P)-dependent oxidoreductase [Euzebya tangerina]|uniref:SDR family NAD(P)-dependent oxidoreductase n=1 Tax=Euzebya tangerina TaxID=591198 RepID=UPI000E30CEC0|nr:SDR family NAD(P)-dependent oxidoreductase [Euzebya tangerina]
MQISDAVAIVTGGASGLGRATAQMIIDAGGRVVLLDLSSSEGSSVAAQMGERATFVPTDVTDADAVAEAVATATSLGPLRIAVNCAGIGGAAKVVGREGAMPLEHFTRIVTVNLIGTFNVIRLAAEAMIAGDVVGEERGVIINTASIAAYDGQIGQSAYAASKGGIVGMTLPLARDLARELVRVVTIAPGLFETPLLAGLPEPAREALAETIPMPARLGQPEEFANLASQIIANTMLNGEVIRLDGALRMAPK